MGSDFRSVTYRVRVDTQSVYTEVSANVREIFGYEPADLIGRSAFDFIHPSDISEARRANDLGFGSPLDAVRHNRFRCKDGHYVWVQGRSRSEHDAQGNIVGFIGDGYRLDSIPEVAGLISAIEEDRLCLEYQPIVDIESGAVVQIEALVRRREGGRLIPPGEFIPLAEQTGVVKLITRWVLAAALRERAAFPERLRAIPLAINVSAYDLSDALFSLALRSALVEGHACERDIVLEITETAVAEGDTYTSAGVERLAQQGYTIALDDFGTGYSSIARLAGLPVGELKIDLSLTADIWKNRDLIRLIVDMARTRNMHVVAEGVEHHEQLDVMRQLGVEAVQGHFISPPVAASRLAVVVEGYRLPSRPMPRLSALTGGRQERQDRRVRGA